MFLIVWASVGILVVASETALSHMYLKNLRLCNIQMINSLLNGKKNTQDGFRIYFLKIILRGYTIFNIMQSVCSNKMET